MGCRFGNPAGSSAAESHSSVVVGTLFVEAVGRVRSPSVAAQN